VTPMQAVIAGPRRAPRSVLPLTLPRASVVPHIESNAHGTEPSG
jgi:hypothetical protein